MTSYTANPQMFEAFVYTEGVDTPTTLEAQTLEGTRRDPVPIFQYGDGDGNDMTHVYIRPDNQFDVWSLLNDGDVIFCTGVVAYSDTPGNSFYQAMASATFAEFYTAV